MSRRQGAHANAVHVSVHRLLGDLQRGLPRQNWDTGIRIKKKVEKASSRLFCLIFPSCRCCWRRLFDATCAEKRAQRRKEDVYIGLEEKLFFSWKHDVISLSLASNLKMKHLWDSIRRLSRFQISKASLQHKKSTKKAADHIESCIKTFTVADTAFNETVIVFLFLNHLHF